MRPTFVLYLKSYPKVQNFLFGWIIAKYSLALKSNEDQNSSQSARFKQKIQIIETWKQSFHKVKINFSILRVP